MYYFDLSPGIFQQLGRIATLVFNLFLLRSELWRERPDKLGVVSAAEGKKEGKPMKLRVRCRSDRHAPLSCGDTVAVALPAWTVSPAQAQQAIAAVRYSSITRRPHDHWVRHHRPISTSGDLTSTTRGGALIPRPLVYLQAAAGLNRSPLPFALAGLHHTMAVVSGPSIWDGC